MKTAAYIRVSTSQQLDGAGPEQQRTNLIVYAMQKGITIDEWAVDDETGNTTDRENIQRLLADAHAGKLQLLLCDRPDRLGRKLEVIETLYQSFRAAGCDVQYVGMAFDSNPAGTAMRQMMSVFAQYQKDEFLNRMKQCKTAKAVRIGALASGTAPYGYKIGVSGRIEPDEIEQHLVKRIFELHDRGQSLREIERNLDKEGFISRSGKSFKYGQIARILKLHRAYQGQAAFSGIEGAQVFHEAIL